MIRLVWVTRRFRGCYETTLAATRLGTAAGAAAPRLDYFPT